MEDPENREWQKKKKERERQMYHLRHKGDYDTLQVQMGASKDECKKARPGRYYSSLDAILFSVCYRSSSSKGSHGEH